MSDHMLHRFPSFTLAAAQADLPRLCQQVAQHQGRLNIMDGACVLISREELDGLERALALLSDSSEVKAMRDSLAHFAAAVQPATLNA